MKHFYILFVAVFFSTFTYAQDVIDVAAERNTTNYIERIQSNIELSDEEISIVKDLFINHSKNWIILARDHKDSPDITERRRELSVKYSLALREAVGIKRAAEIQQASVKKNQ